MATRQTVIRRRYVKDLLDFGYIICALCHMAIEREADLTLDHIIPKSKGGTSRVDNLQPAHKLCNSIKADVEDHGLINPWEHGAEQR